MLVRRPVPRPPLSANITETIDVDTGVAEAFGYVANWQNLDQWDPTFERARKVTDGPVGQGTVFETVMSAGPAGEIPITYRIATYELNQRLVMEGRSDSFTTTDVITFEAIDTGTRVTYDATVDSDAPDWVDALGTPLFKLVGKLGAARGLSDELDR